MPSFALATCIGGLAVTEVVVVCQTVGGMTVVSDYFLSSIYIIRLECRAS